MSEKKASEPSATQPVVITAFKGFDSQMRCRGYKYKVGETFKHDGPVQACESGFHSVENPMDLFTYYAPPGSLYAEVEASGEIARHGSDSKIASGCLHVKVMLSIPDIVGRAIAWVTARCNPATSSHTDTDRSASSSTGDSSASSSTGDRSASSSTGDSSASLSTGGYSSSEIIPDKDGKPLHAVAVATGYQSTARAPAGSAIVLVERNDDGEILHIRAAKVGEQGVTADRWYTLKGGEFVEAYE